MPRTRVRQLRVRTAAELWRHNRICKRACKSARESLLWRCALPNIRRGSGTLRRSKTCAYGSRQVFYPLLKIVRLVREEVSATQVCVRKPLYFSARAFRRAMSIIYAPFGPITKSDFSRTPSVIIQQLATWFSIFTSPRCLRSGENRCTPPLPVA